MSTVQSAETATELIYNNRWLIWLHPIHIPDPTNIRSILKFKTESILQTYPSSMIFYFSEIPTRKSTRKRSTPMQIGIHFDFNTRQITAQYMYDENDLITRPVVIDGHESFRDPIFQLLYQRVPGLMNSIGGSDDNLFQAQIEQARRSLSYISKSLAPYDTTSQIH